MRHGHACIHANAMHEWVEGITSQHRVLVRTDWSSTAVADSQHDKTQPWMQSAWESPGLSSMLQAASCCQDLQLKLICCAPNL